MKKKVGLLFLALFLIVGLAGCNQDILENTFVTGEITQQPENVSFELYSNIENQQKLQVKFKSDKTESLSFKWYKKTAGGNELVKVEDISSSVINKEYTSEYILPKSNFLTEIFFCVVENCNSGVTGKFCSEDAVVSQKMPETGLPCVYINTNDGSDLVKKEDKITSTVRIIDTDGTQLLKDSETIFSGRGNTTWMEAKKPYKIKLSKKVSIFGMPKHKQWVLIANYLDMSFMKNEVAFYLSEQLDMDWTVHGKFVNLIKNGQYVGLYWFGEQIKVDENRVNIDKNEDYLLELDVNYDETWKFKSEIKELPYMVKNDDSMTQERLENLQNKINAMEVVLYSENFPYTDSSKTAYEQSYKNMIDIESMAKFYLVNEIMYNGELCHPKSCYFVFDNTNSILKAGPVWDYDWAAYSNSRGLNLGKYIYYDALFKTNEFNECLNMLTQKLSAENVSDYILELKNEISEGVVLDCVRWGTENRNPVGSEKSDWNEYVSYLEDCVNTRLSAIKNINFEP